jgi:hypothetical protein
MSAQPAFDPARHMTTIRTKGGGRSQYLAARHRILWMRSEHPQAKVLSEILIATDSYARFRCRIELENGAVAEAHGSESVDDFPDFLEKAETKALARALAVLGYGTEGATDLTEALPDTVRHVQLGERTTPAQQRYLHEAAKARHITLNDRPMQWGTVIGVLTKAGVAMDDIADEQGIIPERVRDALDAYNPPPVPPVGDAK